jgi:hypothetical protein
MSDEYFNINSNVSGSLQIIDLEVNEVTERLAARFVEVDAELSSVMSQFNAIAKLLIAEKEKQIAINSIVRLCLTGR